MTAVAPRFLLALDQGTTSSRAALVDRDGRRVAIAAEPFPQSFPRPGWVEHDPEAIWQSQLAAAQRVLAQHGATGEDLIAIGVTNQRETTLLWDRRTGAPIAPAIVWQDRRTAPDCEALRAAGRTAELRRRTGLVPDPYFSATKVAWLLTHLPGARSRAEAGELAFGTVDSYLLWRLTGGRVHATDVSNASRTLLWNLAANEWDAELLGWFGVPAAILPEVRPSAGAFGETEPRWFGRAIPITGVAGDQQAALFGQACLRPGMAKNTYGTGCFLLQQTGEAPRDSAHGLLATAAWRLGDRTEYALEGSVFVAGAVIQWLRDELGLIATAAESASLAAQVEDTGGVFLVPAFTGLGAPHWDPRARGTLVGLTRGTTRAHLVRAALEAIALQTADVVAAMTADAGTPLPSLRVDGGAAANDFLMQLQADLLGVPVERAADRETTALGAAWLAGVGAGVWPDVGELGRRWRADRIFEPQWNADRREQLRAGWARAVERAREWATT